MMDKNNMPNPTHTPKSTRGENDTVPSFLAVSDAEEVRTLDTVSNADVRWWRTGGDIHDLYDGADHPQFLT
jgi:hypothetical protein